jgi:hypothetical protein
MTSSRRAKWRRRVTRNKYVLATGDVQLLQFWTPHYWGPIIQHSPLGLSGHANEDTSDRKASDGVDGVGAGGGGAAPRYFRFMNSQLQNLIKLTVFFLFSYWLRLSSVFHFYLVYSAHFSQFLYFISCFILLVSLFYLIITLTYLFFFSFIIPHTHIHNINLFLLLSVMLL